MRDDKDRAGKWMMEKHGDAILRIGGVTGFTSWRAASSELVSPKRTPDGLLEVIFPNHKEPDLFLIEFLTYPDRRNAEEILRDVMQVYLARGVVPEVLTLVLRPHGTFRLTGEWHFPSRHGWTLFAGRWRVVELWTIPAATLLDTPDVGLVPWAILGDHVEPPEVFLRQCRERIDQQARVEEIGNLLAVAQILTRLRYDDRGLLGIFGGGPTMLQIESPLYDEVKDIFRYMTRQDDILVVLESRFGPIPTDLREAVKAVTAQDRLNDLLRLAAVCPDASAFRVQLGT